MSFSQDDDKEQKTVVGFVVGGAVALAVAISLFFGLQHAGVIGGDDEPATGKASNAKVAASASKAGTAAAVATTAAATAAATSHTGAASGTAATNAAATGAVPADQASVQVVDGVIRFYFASAKADVAAGANEAIKEAVAAAKAGKHLVVSGFHDGTGNAEFNAKLSKERAESVKAVLVKAGVPEASIELKKPEKVEASAGKDAEARRVDVAIKK